MTPAEDFIEFATAESPRLRRMAFLLCGDWHTAEDLAQSTLAKMFVSWHRIRERDLAHAYATRTLANTYIAGRRAKRAGELLTGSIPELPAPSEPPELRMVVLEALATLSPAGPGGRGAALLDGPEHRTGRGPARLLTGNREEPERSRARQAAAAAGRDRGARPGAPAGACRDC